LSVIPSRDIGLTNWLIVPLVTVLKNIKYYGAAVGWSEEGTMMGEI
jgi:hypothetical protein